MPTPADAPTISGSAASVASFSLAKLVFRRHLALRRGSQKGPHARSPWPTGDLDPGIVSLMVPLQIDSLLSEMPSAC